MDFERTEVKAPVKITRRLSDHLPQYEVDFTHPRSAVKDIVTFHMEEPTPNSGDLFTFFRDGEALDHAYTINEADKRMHHAARVYAFANADGRPVVPL